MQPRPSSDCVRSARANIRLAAQTCGAADIARVQRALDLLESAAIEMRQAEAGVRSGTPMDPGEVRNETALLKGEIARMMRVIDGFAALLHGLSVRLGCTALAYTHQGRTVPAPSSAAVCELQG